MNCNETKDLIQLHLDNELDSRATLEVQRHLELCSACASLLQTYAKQDELLKEAALGASLNTEALRKRILEGIARQQKPDRRQRTMALLLRTAAALIIALSTFALVRWGGPGFGGTVYAAVAADHADHCAPDDTHRAEHDVAEIEKMVRRYSHLDQTPDLSSFGYGSVRAIICRINGVHYLHLIYQSTNNQAPISIFFSRDAGGSSAGEIKNEGNFTVLTSSPSSQNKFFIVSSLDQQTAGRLAESISQ
jgi:hypothetical protein